MRDPIFLSSPPTISQPTMKLLLKNIFQTITILLSLLSLTSVSNSFPLSTSSRWIIDKNSGHRVKLACVNWAGHLHDMVPEGLEKKPLRQIAAFVASNGYNCVRLTWATYMFTRSNYSSLSVTQSLDHWGLVQAREGMAKNNPWIMGLTPFEAQRAVVNELGAHKVMVVLDNHVSLPKWCCGGKDGNGFFGDEYFDPDEWLQGLSMVAKLYKGIDTVVGMSMRNELRGPHQNENDWYKYIQMGATTIHAANPDVLVIVSGLSYDTNLGFLKKKPLSLGSNLESKLVYEAHWYSFGDPTDQWMLQTNGFCAKRTRSFMSGAGFLTTGPNPAPLFLSEFGVDQRGVSERDNRYLSCLLGFLAERDLDWALWTLQGSYKLREGKVGMEETFGLVDANWDHLRNSTLQDKLKLVQQMTQDPSSKWPTNYVMFHPQSGRCARLGRQGLCLSNCLQTSKWSYGGNGTPIRLTGTSRCLTIDGDGLPPILSDDCSSQRSRWESVSESKFHMAAQDGSGSNLCLDWSSSNSSAVLLTKKCLCLDNDLKDVPSCAQNPQNQWFKLVPTNK
ncbi:glycosyl hydrolase 5 family protein-like [Rhododendron vialii]|uniref:glycosyl hydrolase 5 family protein-like n=1 Tax=Rhododendron vialii TaxID=182163 RepID=UPI00265E57B7|nr:glycosyl hydrolase 5 family protein-like [Rhododendron vialii]